MKFVVKKEDLYNGIKIVDRATSVKALQPVLLNLLVETVDKGTIKLTATDLDMTVIALVDAQVEEEGKITIPSKTLNEIVSKLSDGQLINISSEEGETLVNITSRNSKFDVYSIAASEFPSDLTDIKVDEESGFEIELKPFKKAVEHAGFAAAGYETSNLLSGIVCEINDGILEVASTDGNRLARVREKINSSNKTEQLIIPSKALNEFIKMSSFIGEDKVKIYKEKSKIIIKSETTTTVSRLLEGQFPKYNQLIPAESPKEAIVNVSQLASALDRVSIMVNEKTSIVKLEFAENTLKLSADTPDSGKSEDSFDIDYKGEELAIAFNYKYVLEALKNIQSEEVKIGLNTALSATVFKPNNEEDLICLIMPVQIRS